MEASLSQLWQLLGLPQVWGALLTIVVIAVAFLLRTFVNHALELQLERFRAEHGEMDYFRHHYAGISNYSSEQARQLRQAYLTLFDPDEADADVSDEDLADRLDLALACVLRPVREHLGILDEPTAQRMYKVANYLRNFKGREDELKGVRTRFFRMTEGARKYAKADRIAFRLGLTQRTLERWKEVNMVRVRVLENDIGVEILGGHTTPGRGDEPELTEDEWLSAEVQKLVADGKIEKIED